MILELIYTSAPRTLDGPGYGVVAKSANMPEPLEAYIRQLNSYDFDLSVHSGSTPSGPVVFSHTTFPEHAPTWHVLSRVGPGGYDYSQRAVYLAHHVALKGAGLRGAAVLDLLREPSMFQSEWDGNVGLVPARGIPSTAPRTPPRAPRSLGAGHLDWLKAWGESRDQQVGGACFLIVARDADVLELFGEALSLFPQRVADDITFITHMNGHRPGIHFDWVGLVAGSDLARSVAGRFPDRTLDLTKPYVGAVRTPARKESAIVAKPRPKKQASAPRPPVAPARHSQDFDGIWQDEVRRGRDPEIAAGPPMSAVSAPPLPPPPPPSSAFRRIAAPMIVLSLVLSSAILGFAILRPGKTRIDLPQDDPQVAHHPTILTPDNVLPSATAGHPNESATTTATKVPPEKPHEPGTQQPTPPVIAITEKKQESGTPPKRSGSAQDSGESKTYYLTSWLVDPDKKDAWQSGGNVPVDSVVDSVISNFKKPTLNLLSCKGFDLKVRQTADSKIEVSSRGPQGTVDSMSIAVEDRRLVWKGTSPSPGNLLVALQFSILRIDRFDHEQKPSSLRIAFRPRPDPLDPIRLHNPKKDPVKAGGSIVPPSNPPTADARRVLEAIIRESKTLDPHFRVGRMTLSICNEADAGWVLKPEQDIAIGGTFEFQVTYPGDTWPAKIRVSGDIPQGEHPTIKAELIDPHVPAEVTTPEQASDGGAKPTAKASRKSSKKASDRKDLNKRKGAERSAQEAATTPKIDQPDAPESIDNDSQRLQDFFTRFGLIHGSIVIFVKDGETGKEEPIDLLQFGRPRQLGQP